MDNIKKTDRVLLLCKFDNHEAVPALVEEVKSCANKTVLDNMELFINSKLITPSSFDVIVSNWLTPYSLYHSDEYLAKAALVLKPSGKLIAKDKTSLTSKLTLAGFINITKIEDVYVAEKPSFEVGSKEPLKLGKTVKKIDDTVEAAWTVDNDDDIIDDNQLLDDNDLKAPDKEALKVCATTGKRKACADCSCGLAEELKGETKEAPKSSCGSCYLGDAFRCASCPYLGMPAFKPGEKVLLDNMDDI